MKSPQGPETGKDRVFRGGSWFNDAGHSRAAFRAHWRPGDGCSNLGFRLVLVPRRKKP